MIALLWRLFFGGSKKRRSRRVTMARAAYRGAKAGYKAGRWINGR